MYEEENELEKVMMLEIEGMSSFHWKALEAKSGRMKNVCGC